MRAFVFVLFVATSFGHTSLVAHAGSPKSVIKSRTHRVYKDARLNRIMSGLRKYDLSTHDVHRPVVGQNMPAFMNLMRNPTIGHRPAGTSRDGFMVVNNPTAFRKAFGDYKEAGQALTAAYLKIQGFGAKTPGKTQVKTKWFKRPWSALASRSKGKRANKSADAERRVALTEVGDMITYIKAYLEVRQPAANDAQSAPFEMQFTGLGYVIPE